MKIAIVGGGISGLGAAWLLARQHEIHLFESGAKLGGHANTVEIRLDGRVVPVDSGFIVYNERNYPNLTRLFAALDVETVASDMSFSVSMDDGGFEYFGSPLGLLAQPSNLARPAFRRLLGEMRRFYREAPGFAARPDLARLTLGELLAEGGYSDDFARRHLLPMAAAIWSSTLDDVLAFPAETFVRFFDNHGLFSLTKRPQWRSVLGGSRNYVEALSAPFRSRTRLFTPIVSLRRTRDGLILRDTAGHESCFDQVVVACHADQALALLGPEASEEERAILGAFRYQDNHAVLHRDRSLMPRRRRVWASWNHLAAADAATSGQVSVSYWMNRLQPLNTVRDLFVTLNPLHAPAPELTHADFVYNHPQFDRAALEAQGRLPAIQGRDGVWFCGAYCGYGFHEDGLQAGLSVAEALGQPAPWADQVAPMSPAWRAVVPAVPPLAAE